MKKTKTKKPNPKIVKELVTHFEAALKKSLPISVQPDGSIVYKNYYIKQNDHENWAIYDIRNKDVIEQFYLKTCAIMAAKEYSKSSIEKFIEIKRLDTRYWAYYSDTMIYSKNIKTAKDYDRYLVLLNKLEHSKFLAEHFQEKISTMFKWSFV